MKYLVIGLEEVIVEFERGRTMMKRGVKTEIFSTKLDAEVASRTWGNNKYYEVSASHEMVMKAEWVSKCL